MQNYLSPAVYSVWKDKTEMRTRVIEESHGGDGGPRKVGGTLSTKKLINLNEIEIKRLQEQYNGPGEKSETRRGDEMRKEDQVPSLSSECFCSCVIRTIPAPAVNSLSQLKTKIEVPNDE